MAQMNDQALLDWMTKARREMHRIPEFAYDLDETRAYVRHALQEAGADRVEDCDKGIKAVFLPERGGDRDAIAFRSDMDALKMDEKSGCPFASAHPGMMHACGHDGHMAVLLGLAQLISGRRSELTRPAVLLFQPAEENFGGAKRMIEAGALENPKVGEIYGLHLMPQIPLGKIGCRSGAMLSCVDAMRITFAGKTAHGAAPQDGRDAIMAAAHFISSTQAAIARRISPFEPAVFTVGTIQGGTAFNIVSDRCELTGSIRAYSHEVTKMLREIIAAAITSANGIFGTTCDTDTWVSYPAVVNDPEKAAKVRRLAGDQWIDTEPVTVSEDFSEFLLKVPGAHFFLGYGDDAHREPLHSAKFNFDERALLTGVRLLEKLAFEETA